MTRVLGSLTPDQIKRRVEEHLDFYKKNYPNKWVGIFLQGSQNYDLASPTSDVDTKIIVLPSFEELIFNRKPISHTLVLPNNEHCDVKDIRLMFECFRKQNINFLEILFTQYKIMNPRFEDLFQPMFDSREMIAHYNNYAGINSMNGMIHEKHKSMFHPTPATEAVIKEHGYNGKDLCHMWRIHDFMRRFFFERKSFEECMFPESEDYYDNYMLSKEQGFVLGYASEIAEAIDQKAKKMRDLYLSVNENIVHEDVKVIMDGVLISIMQNALQISEVANA